jgi:hypothetical protein
LILPWLVRLLPKMRYIFWIRDARDAVLGNHVTDDLSIFNIPHDVSPDANPYLARSVSWMYQVAIVNATPKPENWLVVRFEDFVLRQEEELRKLRAYLPGTALRPVATTPDKVGAWTNVMGSWHTQTHLHFINPLLQQFGYLHTNATTSSRVRSHGASQSGMTRTLARGSAPVSGNATANATSKGTVVMAVARAAKSCTGPVRSCQQRPCKSAQAGCGARRQNRIPPPPVACTANKKQRAKAAQVGGMRLPGAISRNGTATNVRRRTKGTCHTTAPGDEKPMPRRVAI